jgi:hypothetical protein
VGVVVVVVVVCVCVGGGGDSTYATMVWNCGSQVCPFV